MNKLTVRLDNEQFTTKPTNAKNIVSRLGSEQTNTTLTAKELADELILGKSFKPSISGTKESEWISQQVFVIDIDSGITILEAIDKYKHLGIAFIHTSFSNTDSNNKFRMIFIAEEEVCDFEVAKSIQLNLMNTIVESDASCKNLNRIYYGGKEIVYENYDSRLQIEELIKCIERMDSILTTSNESTYMYHTSDILVRVHPSISVLKLEGKEYYEYIYQYDMYEILNDIGIKVNGNTFKCILPNHDDENPSAGIIISEKDGHYLYNCFGCNRTLNNITLIEYLYGYNRYEALRFLEKIIGVTKEATDEVKALRDKIEVNIEYIVSGNFENDFPDIHSFLRGDMEHLVYFYEFAKYHISDPKYKDALGNPIVFASLSKIMKELDIKSKATANKTMILFSLLEIINKLSMDNMPEYVKNNANDNINHGKYTSHYSINNLGYNFLCGVQNTISTLKKNGYSKKALSWENITRTYTKELANKILPQIEISKTTFSSDDRTMKIASFILSKLTNSSYVSFNSIISNHAIFDLSKAKTELQLKRSAQEICDSYGLLVVKATLENKEKYNIPKEINHNKSVFVREIE